MKNKNLNSIIILILTIILMYILMKDNYQEIFNTILNINPYWTILSIILYIGYLLLQSIPFLLLSNKYKYNIKFGFMFYLSVVTNFFNGITPLATGGQPLQAYELYKKGITMADATNIVIQNSIIFKFGVCLWGILALIINDLFNLIPAPQLLKNLTRIGLLLNALVIVLLFMLSFSKKTSNIISNFIINLLYKLHIIKDKEKTLNSWNKTCNEFYDNSKILLQNKKILITGTLIEFISLTFYYVLPITLAYAINCGNNLTVINTLLISSYVYMASSYLPIPGATGGAEYAFINYLKIYINTYKLNALLILWRTITYYLPTIIGGIAFNINHTKKNN